MNYPIKKRVTEPTTEGATEHTKAYQLTKGTTFKLGVMTAAPDGGSAQKRFLHIDGKAIKDDQHSQAIWSGELTDHSPIGLEGVADLVGNIGSNQALILGSSGRDETQTVITDKARQLLKEMPENTITRSLEFLKFRENEPCILLFDRDVEPGSTESLDGDGLRALMAPVIPGLENVGYLETQSSSSNIYDRKSGACLKGAGNFHLFNAAIGNVARFRDDYLKVKFWALGMGFFKFSTPHKHTGRPQILERFPIDMSVFSPERLVFEAGPKLPDSLEWRPGEPTFKEGTVLPLDDFRVTAEEFALAKTNRTRARKPLEEQRIKETAAKVRSARPSLSESESRKEARRLIQDDESGILQPDHELYFQDGRKVLAGELDKSHLQCGLHDPLEPDYKNWSCCAKIIPLEGGAIGVSSFAHGTCKKYTIMQPQNTGDRLSLKDSITSAIELGLIGSDLEERKIQICSEHKLHALALDVLWRQIEREIEQREGRSDRSDAIDSLLLKKSRRLDISRILPGQLAPPLKRRAELLGSTPEVLLTALLPVIASQVKIGTKLHLSRGSEWEALPIFWTGIVGEPATAKSPSLNVFLKPLRGIQGQDIDRYKAEAKRYESDKEKSDDPDSLVEPKKPLRQLVDDITIEALARIQDEQPEHGCLIGVDELAGFVNSFGQYKGGKGGDKQKILSIRDGKGFSVSRSGKDDIMTSASSFSLCGAIQPGVLAQQMGDFTDSDGYWSRFCWCLLPLLRKQLETFEDGPIAQNLRSDLEFIFRSVKELEPIDYELSEAALTLYRDFREEMEDRRMDHPNNTMKIVHGKAQGQVGEIALVLHLMWGVGNDAFTPERTVSAPTFQRAIEVMRFYIVQAELIQALGQEVQGGEDSIYGKILELGREKGWIKASDVNNWIRAIKDDKTRGAEYVRGLFVELEAMGKGELRGEGRSLQFKPFSVGEVVHPVGQSLPEGWTEQDLKDLKDTVTANPDAASSLRECVPKEYWSEIGI